MQQLARRGIFLIMACLSLTIANAQIDSLKTVIETAGQDTAKVQALNLLAGKLFGSNHEEAFKYAQQAVKLAESIAYTKGQTNGYDKLARYYWMTGDFPKATEYLNKKLKIFQSQGDKYGIANTYDKIGIINAIRAFYPEALEYHFKSLSIQEELDDRRGMASSYNNIGIVYDFQSSYSKALEYYFKSLEIDEELGNRHGMADGYNNIGIIYENQSDYPRALEYHFKALELKGQIGDKKSISISYTNVGSVYAACYAYVNQDGQDQVATGNDGILEQMPGWAAENPARMLDTAMYYQQKALEVLNVLGDKYGMALNFSLIASIHYEQGKYQDALNYYEKSALLADSIGAVQPASDAHKGLSGAYEQTGQYEKSLEHYMLYTSLKDSTFNEEKSKDLGKLEARHEMQKAEAERKRLKIEQSGLESARIDRRNLLQYSGILIFIVAFFITLLFSGRLNIPVRLAEGGIFFTFLLVFEFLLVLTDPYLEQYTGGEPAYKLIINAGLAGLIFPLHSIAETRLKRRLFKNKRRKVEEKTALP